MQFLIEELINHWDKLSGWEPISQFLKPAEHDGVTPEILL